MHTMIRQWQIQFVLVAWLLFVQAAALDHALAHPLEDPAASVCVSCAAAEPTTVSPAAPDLPPTLSAPDARLPVDPIALVVAARRHAFPRAPPSSL